MALSIDDRLAILDLVARYNHAADSDDGAAWAATFTEDGVFAGSASAPVEGRAALEAFGNEGVARRGRVRHWTNNALIDGDGDEATLRLYLLVMLLGEDGNAKLGHTGVYHDELRRLDGEWLFARRTVRPDMPPAWAR